MRLILLASSALIAAPALAQQAPADREVDEIIVTSSPIQTTEFTAVQNIDVLSKDEILSEYGGSLGDTLSAEPGVSTTFFGPAAGRPIIRGLGNQRVRILTNGVGVVDASTASPDHAVTTEGLEAESIEILRGAGALAYGGNAIAGVVNVIDGTVPSKKPEDGNLEGSLYGGYESVNEGWQSAGSLTGAAGPLVVTVKGLHREGDDYEIPGFAESARLRALEEEEHAHEGEEEHAGHEHEEEASGLVPNSGYEFDSASIGASLVGDDGFIGVALKGFSSTYGLPGHDHAHEEEGHEHEEGEAHEHEEEAHAHGEEGAFIDMEQTRVDLRGEHRLDIPVFERIRGSAAWGDYEHTEFEAPGEPGTVFRNEGWEGRLELTQRQRQHGNWTGAVGGQAAYTDFVSIGEESFIPRTETTDLGLFTVQRYDAGGWGGELGARVENRELETAAMTREFDAVSVSGGLFARPSEPVFLSANIAFTQRAPSDAELFANGPHLATNQYEVGDPDLEIEEAVTYELLGRYRTGRFRVEAAAWAADYSSFIFLAPVNEEIGGLPVFRFVEDDANLYGFEAGGEAQLFTLGPADLSADVSAEWVSAENGQGDNLPRIPPFSSTLGLEAEMRDYRLTLRAEAELVAEQDEVFANELPTDAYQLYNLKAEWKPLADRDISLIAQLKNLTDEEARIHASYLKDQLPLPGRSFRIALKADF